MLFKPDFFSVKVINIAYLTFLPISLILFIIVIAINGFYKSFWAILFMLLVLFFIAFSSLFLSLNLINRNFFGEKTIKTKAEKKSKKVTVKKEELEKEKIIELHNRLIRRFKRNYKELPKGVQRRTQIEREVAKAIQQIDGSFTISGLLSALVKIFPRDLNRDRREIVQEIEAWVLEDTYTQMVKKDGNVSHYQVI